MLKATVYCNHLLVNFTKTLLKLFMETLRGRKLSSLICRGLNHNHWAQGWRASAQITKQTNVQSFCFKRFQFGRTPMAGEVSEHAPVLSTQTAHSRKELREIQCSEVSQCHWTVLGSHLKRADWIFLVYCGLLLWTAISCSNSWWGGQVESWESKTKPLPPPVQCLAPCINGWPTPKGLQSRNYLTPEESGN